MIRFKKIPLIFIFIIILLVSVVYFPVDFAVKQKDLGKNQKFIIVKYTGAPESFWEIVGDENGLYENKNLIKDIHLTGNKPTKKYGDELAIACYYLCYVDYIDKRSFTNISEGLEFDLYNVRDCKMIYPIKRRHLYLTLSETMPMPQSYITLLDLFDKKNNYSEADLEDELLGLKKS